MTRGLRSALAMLAAAALASCGSDGPVTQDGTSCYPEAARPWITRASAAPGALRDPGGPMSIYLDGSASMVGFIRGGTANERPLADLIGLLPTLDTIDHAKLSVTRFDRSFTELKPGDVSRMQTEAAYLCPSGNRDCDAQESHIDQALERVAKEGPRSLSVVVSDLWLANSDVRTTDGVAFSKPLADIFSSGRSIAVYGFESPYAGRVSDLPSGSTGVTAKRRHLFLMVAGPVERLRAFRDAMRNAPSASIARALGDGKAKYSLFTLEPVILAADERRPFELQGNGALNKGSFLTVRTGVRVPQYQLDRSAALRASSPAGARWAGVTNADVLPGAVWQGASRGTTRLYRRVSDKCLPNGGDWRDEGLLEGGWSDGEGSSFTLKPSDLATLPPATYLLVGSAQRTSLQSPNPATQWMRDWSFDAATEAAAVKAPVVPTLNLAETARLLELALLKSAEAKPMNIGGFVVAVKVE